MKNAQDSRAKTTKLASELAAGMLVVVYRKGTQQAIIKLREASYNSLGWGVWTFTLVSGVMPCNVFVEAPMNRVEVVLPLESPDRAPPAGCSPIGVAKKVYDVYVQISQGSTGYNVYSFLRHSIAKDVRDCATRFQLVSFIIPCA
jgi:hypothetical protein